MFMFMLYKDQNHVNFDQFVTCFVFHADTDQWSIISIYIYICHLIISDLSL